MSDYSPVGFLACQRCEVIRKFVAVQPSDFVDACAQMERVVSWIGVQGAFVSGSIACQREREIGHVNSVYVGWEWLVERRSKGFEAKSYWKAFGLMLVVLCILQ